MFELFQSTTQRPNAQRMPAEFEYIRGMYLRELLRLQEYYQSRVYAVKNQNLLVRLLTHVDTPMEYHVDRYVEVTRTRAPYIAKAFKLTSEIDYGVLHPGAFFGPGTDEIIIYEDSYFDPVYAEKNWKRICAVTPIWHPRSDLGFMLPNGKATSTDTGLAVVTVNLPLLAVQFRAYLRDQIAKREHVDSGSLGITHFVHMYVLPNMMYAHTNLVLVNRLMRLYYGIPTGESKQHHPFQILQYANKLDNVMVKLLDDYHDRPMQYEWLLHAMPSITGESMEDSLQVPSIPPTRQVWWAMMLSRLDVMKFLIDFGGEESIRRNRVHLNKLQRDLKRLKREAIYDRLFPYERSRSIEITIDELMSV